MRFQKNFVKRQVKVWSDFYVDYALMVKLLQPIHTVFKEKEKSIYKKQQMLPSLDNEINTNQILTQMIRVDDQKIDVIKEQQKFYEQFILELKKADHFYNENLNGRLIPRLNMIKSQIEHAKEINEFKIYQDTFEMALKELYKELVMIDNFADMNLNAKDRLLVKYKKYTQFFDKELLINVEGNVKEFLTKMDISTSKVEIDKLIEDVNHIFNVCFMDKYKSKTKKVLRAYSDGNKFTQSQSFYLGFFIGLLLFQLAITVIIAYNYNIDMDNDVDFKSVFPMFRTFFIVCLYWWILGFNVWVWNKADISYKVIFQFDNHYSDVISIYKRAAIFTFILLFCVLLYLFDRIGIDTAIGFKIPVHVLPLICWGSFIFYMFCPVKKIFNYKGRTYLFKLFTESIGSFFMKPDFRHVWLIDQMTSLIGPMRDMEYTLCYYAYYDAPLFEKKSHCNNTRGIFLFIAFFPNTIRILQCVKTIYDSGKGYPQKYNVIKYCLNLAVATLSFFWPSYPILHTVWLCTSFFSTCYSFVWDIKFDFGFLQKGKNYPLRDRLCYSSKGYYYTVVILNFFLRYLWLVTLSPEVINSLFRPETLSIILYSLEIFRRGMWNCIRVETKHLEISKEFRVTNDVELPFIKQGNKFVPNESNLLEIMGMSREEKIRVEMDKILEEKGNKKIKYESRFIQEFEPLTKEKINDELNEYLRGYRTSTEENIHSGEEGYQRREFSRKI